MDLFAQFRENRGPLGQYAENAEGYYIFPQLKGELGNRMEFRGKEVICWSINNYLGLANHPEIRKVDGEAAARWGMAYPMGARLMSGDTDKHYELEANLADFVQKEACVLVNFGYQGIMSAIDSLTTRRDVIVYDSESHACIIDGVRMHLGKRFAFEHNDMDSLKKNLERATAIVEKTGGGILVISEGVFGMRGDLGNLPGIIELKKQYEFRLLVDDAHGFGTMGETGYGTGEHFDCQDEIDVYFSTFAKSMAGIGAFLAGDKDIIQFLKYNMRSQVFAKSLPMAIVEGAIKRLDMLRTMPEFKNNLWSNVRKLQSGLRARGLELGNTESCVTPVYLEGTAEQATQVVYDLRENFGIFCSVVVYPVIPKGIILLRLIPTAVHTDEDIERTLEAFSEIAKRLKKGAYQSVIIE